MITLAERAIVLPWWVLLVVGLIALVELWHQYVVPRIVRRRRLKRRFGQRVGSYSVDRNR
jgi:hypothetical protein